MSLNELQECAIFFRKVWYEKYRNYWYY